MLKLWHAKPVNSLLHNEGLLNTDFYRQIKDYFLAAIRAKLSRYVRPIGIGLLLIIT